MNERRTKYMTTNDIINDWLREYTGSTVYKHRESLMKFLDFLGKDIDQVMKEYKATKDKIQWSREMGHQVAAFYKYMEEKGYAVNTCRTWTIGVRAFFSAKATPLKIKRGSIPRSTIASGEHPFLQNELQRMYYFADTFDKALLSLGVSIGFSSGDFLNLKRSFIENLVNYAIENETEFPYFDYNRGKTKTFGRSFLMPEAIKCLKMYLDTTKANSEDKLFALSPDSLNDHLKAMTRAANIKTKGTVKWHLLRKFLFTGLLKAMDLLSAKLVLGKSISADLLTYLITNEETLRKKYKKAYPYIRLSENGDRIGKTEQELTMYKAVLAKMIREAIKDINPDMSDEDTIALYLRK